MELVAEEIPALRPAVLCAIREPVADSTKHAILRFSEFAKPANRALVERGHWRCGTVNVSNQFHQEAPHAKRQLVRHFCAPLTIASRTSARRRCASSEFSRR